MDVKLNFYNLNFNYIIKHIFLKVKGPKRKNLLFLNLLLKITVFCGIINKKLLERRENMNKVIGYGCVATSRHSVKDNRLLSDEEVSWRQQTKVAQEIKKLTDMFLPRDCVRIDIIGGSYRNRRYLKECLENMGYGDSIVVSRLSSLGLNNKELVENYRKIFECGIGLLLPDYGNPNGVSKYSTTDYSFSPILITSEEFNILCDELSFIKIESQRGRKKIEVTKEFKLIYWMYERYLIDPVTAFKNKYFEISKNTFRRLSEQYENSDEYNIALEEQDSLYKIHEIPKRFGVISPELQAMIDAVARGASFEDARTVHRIDINLIQFMRYFAKSLMPKKLIVKITNERRDYELIESLQPSYEKPS